jgi:hypothetical protein
MVGVRGKTHVLAGVVLGGVSLLAAGPAWPQKVVTTLPHKGVLAVPAPGQLDVAVIDAIAEIGAQQVITFPAFSDVTGFIARKCGKPSLVVAVHPRYREKLIARNKNEAAVDPDPLQLSEDRTLTLPACSAGFALRQEEFEAPSGIQALVQKLAIPFDMERFRRLTRAPNFKTAVVGEFRRLAANPYPDGPVCRAADLASFFRCVNTIEIAYINRDRASSHRS